MCIEGTKRSLYSTANMSPGLFLFLGAEETDVLHSPRRPGLFIFFTDNLMHLVEANEIASVSVL